MKMKMTDEFKYKPELAKDWATFEEADKNLAQLEAIDQKARSRGQLVGRYIRHQYADSYAMYQITAEAEKKVTIEVVRGIGDDWVLPAWGEKTSIPKAQAQELITSRDRLNAIFEQRALAAEFGD